MRLNSIFCEGMIFQANKPIRLFGTGGGILKIDFCGYHYEEDKRGAKWEAELPPMPYGGPYEMDIVMNDRKQTLHDIYIGDLYILAGQSNMQFKLGESEYDMSLCKDDPLLRYYSTERAEGGASFFPQDGWVKAKTEDLAYWSCLGYLVGRTLREQTDRAIGIIACYQGAADIQTYMPDSAFENPDFNIPDDERYDMMFSWNHGHSQLYNYQLKQLLPYSTAAVLWYQGESNVSEKESEVYGEMLSCLIHSWRDAFRDAELPFVVVQLPDNIERAGAPWSRIQQAQEDIQYKEEHVVTVISRDICENDNLHPKKKNELGRRIANAIMSMQ